jgi:Fe-S-cluster containining protein
MTPDRELVEAWLAAVRRPEVSVALEAVYVMVGDEVAARGPACWGSGRCCNFRKAGHRLYVTGLEAAYHVSRVGAVAGLGAIEAAGERGDCPYLEGNLCGAHGVKPLGCRVYFCDRSAQRWQEELTERGLGMIRRIHDEHGIEYRYGEWLGMLRAFGCGG